MFLSPAAFNAFLGSSVRQDLIWRRAFACPCINPHSGQGDQNCSVCGALGWTWSDGVAAHTGMQGLKPTVGRAMFGLWDDGDMQLTIPSDSPLYGAGMYDRLQLEATVPFSQNITPGVNERLHGKIIDIDRVFWIVDGAIIEGDAPEIDAVGRLSWSGAEPPEGVSFSISGRKHVELFLAKELPGSRNSGVGGLPRRVAARRFDMLGRSGVDPSN